MNAMRRQMQMVFQDSYSSLNPRMPEWLTGGKYGVEASMTGAAAIVVGLILVSTLPFRKLPQPELKTAAEPALHNSLSGIKS